MITQRGVIHAVHDGRRCIRMFDCGISAAELIEDVISEADIAIPISNRQYVQWLNSLEQMLYTEIIKEQHRITISAADNNIIDLEAAETSENQARLRFEDIYAVYTDNGVQLTKTTVTSGTIFPNSYYKQDNNMAYNTLFPAESIDIVYFIRPALKAVDETDAVREGNINVPPEFIDLIKTKLRAEAYKLANEDSIAAKWISDYNVLLETFKEWINNKAPQFGM